MTIHPAISGLVGDDAATNAQRRHGGFTGIGGNYKIAGIRANVRRAFGVSSCVGIECGLECLAAGNGTRARGPPRCLKVGRVPIRVRVTVVNVFDTVALYNFLSTFSGTHFVTPRAVQLQLTLPF